MQQDTIKCYNDFALRVLGYYEEGKFYVKDTLTGKILFESQHRPYNTPIGAHAFFLALYKFKKNELN